jgi:ankyrin repeat protein
MTEILYNNTVHDPDTIKIRQDIKSYRDSTCRHSRGATCRIDDIKIRNIAYFFTSVITKCPLTNITLNDIKKLQIIGRGTFGYGVSLPNKIVKIIICENTLDSSIYKEIKYNKIITNSNNDHFIKLLGYFLRENKEGLNVYNYYDNSNNFTKKICYTKNDNLDTLCEIYLILEKADNGELYNYSKHITKDLLSFKINDLLNMYKINKYFIDNYNVIFIHGDIKDNNIVVMNDGKLKLIDYGLSTTSEYFFYISQFKLTYFKNLYGEIEYRNIFIYISPFYDVWCILLTFWMLYYDLEYKISADTVYKYILNDTNKNINILINKYLYILTYNIHIFFYKINEYFTDYFDDFIDIRIVKFIYNNIFMIDDLPHYIDTGNVLLDDYNYFNNIMMHMLTISKEYPQIKSLDIDNILISHITENIKYSDIELFNLMNNVNSQKIIENIILKFTDNNFLDENKNNLLYFAINKNLSIDVIKKIIEKNININNINNDLDTVLSFAIKNKKSDDLIKLLINNNSNINYIDNNVESIYHLLLNNGYNSIIELIIDKILYFNIKDLNNNNELQYGIIKKLPSDILMKLIDKVNINNINKDGYNSLHLAIQYHYIDIIKKLLEKNIDINTNIVNIKSTLYLCLENDILDENILLQILEKTVVNKEISRSPINIGLQKNISLKLIDKMIDIFDVNYIDEYNNNSITILSFLFTNDNFNDYYNIMLKLINKNININHIISNNINIIGIILSNKQLKHDNKLILVKKLIENNIDLICENMKPSLLMLGLDNKLPDDIIEKFINNKTINYIDDNKINALYDTISKNYSLDIIKKLINAGINITQLSIYDQSPLAYALQYQRNIDIIKLLIHPNIINIHNKDNIYPIDLATKKCDINIIGLLLINNSVLSIKSIDNIIQRFTEKECIEIFKISTYIKDHLLDYINFFKDRYKKIDKHIDTELYKKNKHIYNFLLTLKK